MAKSFKIALTYSESLLNSVVKTLIDNIFEYQEDIMFIVQSVKPAQHNLNLHTFEDVLKHYFSTNKLELFEWQFHFFPNYSYTSLKLIENDEDKFVFVFEYE